MSCPECPHCARLAREVVAAWRAGATQDEIADRLGLTQSRVSRILRRQGATVSDVAQRARSRRGRP